jgi:YbbR domain-containing protein
LTEKETHHNKKGEPKSSQQISAAIFITCMGIAALLWLSNKLSHEYESELSASVNYINIPEGNILGGKTSQHLTLQIKSKGFNLIWLKLRGKKVNLFLNAAKLPQGRNAIAANRIKSEIASQLDKEYEMVAIHPDSLFYSFDKKYSVTVPVAFNSNLDFEPQYGLASDVVLIPAKVQVSGPRNEVMAIEKVETMPVTFNNLKETKEGEVALKKFSSMNVEFNPSVVQYKIAVEEFTEQEIEVEIKTENVPKKVRVDLYPKKVKVICQVTIKDFDKLKSAQFKAVADFRQVDFSKDKYVEIQIKQLPDIVKRYHQTPRKAEYIIYK